jgi:hypothetical protein
MNEILEQNFYRDSFSIWYGAETLTLRKVNQKYLLTFENCCWRRMEKVKLMKYYKESRKKVVSYMQQ